MKSPGADKRNDKALGEAARLIIAEFRKELTSASSEFGKNNKYGWSLGEAGSVVFTEQLSYALSAFVNRATTLLGAAAGHEKAIFQIALAQAHTTTTQGADEGKAAKKLIDEVFDKALASWQYLAPNFLFRLNGVKSIQIGKVQALRTQDFVKTRQKTAPGEKIDMHIATDFNFAIENCRVKIGMPPVCWLVDVDAAQENVEEEARWLIEIATSLLSLVHRSWQGPHPRLGDIEPHPMRRMPLDSLGIKYRNKSVLVGGSKIPPWYEIDSSVVKSVKKASASKAIALVFSPPANSLAERVARGLGWLARGRQSHDRAERLLNFFTAIEALLSTSDKSAPVVQTIARHASVLLTDDNAERVRIAAQIRKLYDQRSALVHNGARAVVWSVANDAQALAEALYWHALESADLSMKHSDFSTELGSASYGLLWQRRKRIRKPRAKRKLS